MLVLAACSGSEGSGSNLTATPSTALGSEGPTPSIETAEEGPRPSEPGISDSQGSVPPGSADDAELSGRSWLTEPWPLESVDANPSSTITVDFSISRDDNPSRFGVLHGLGHERPSDELVTPLRPALIRAAAESSPPGDVTAPLSRVLELGAVYNLLLSDSWGNPPDWRAPYDHLDEWDELVRQTITEPEVAEAFGEDPEQILFEPWNEPVWPQFFEGTDEQFYEVFLTAERAIHDTYPDALVAGPSRAYHDIEWIERFLDHLLAEHARLDIFTLHAFHTDVVSLGQDLAQIREVILDNPKYAPLGIRGIVVNEFVWLIHDQVPAANLGFLYHLEEGGVLAAARACWITCFSDSLGGLLVEDSHETRSAWWIYRAYGAGVDSRVASATTDPLIVAISSTQGMNEGAQIILGHIDSADGRQPTPVTLSLVGLDTIRTGDEDCVEFTGRTIPSAGETPVPELDIAYTWTEPLDGVRVATTIPEPIAPNEAHVLSLKPVHCEDEP